MINFQRLAPIIYVADLAAEVAFYEAFGFAISYRGADFPNFIAVKQGELEFGIEHRPEFSAAETARSFFWQFVVDDLNGAVAICQRHGFAYNPPKCYWEAGDGWSMEVQSPNGYTVSLEGPTPGGTR